MLLDRAVTTAFAFGSVLDAIGVAAGVVAAVAALVGSLVYQRRQDRYQRAQDAREREVIRREAEERLSAEYIEGPTVQEDGHITYPSSPGLKASQTLAATTLPS